MEYLLVFYFNMYHGSVSTERLKTYEECQYLKTINDVEIIRSKHGEIK